ncbi:MAG TPA: hypothetical protein VNJ01_04045 [Bacteriovoracaceae bacterium]|nr:hypothetical protein [Bacteriovoracaceae bacterium]
MISRAILLLIVLTTSAGAFDKDFTTVNAMVPLEFSYLFDSLKAEIHSPKEKIRMVGLCKELDDNLGYLQKDQIFLMMKSEVIKNVLQHKFRKTRSPEVTKDLITRLEVLHERKHKLLTPFAAWIWRSIIAELKHRDSLGLITEKNFTASTYTGAKLEEAQRFNRYLTYLLPWIDIMESSDPEEFNFLAKNVSWIILRRLNDRSLLFKRFASTAVTGMKTVIFNIPQKLLELHPEDIKRMQNNDEDSLSLSEKAATEKTKALRQVDKATVEDMSPVSDDLARELEKKEK